MFRTVVYIPCYFVIFKFLVFVASFNIDTKYPIFFESKEKDYFGYSVGLLRNREGKHVLITAPRANSSIFGNQVYQPGVLFKCKISFVTRKQTCTEVLLDAYANTVTYKDANFSYMDKKDNMFLGVSLDVQQNSKNNKVVICGHLWKNQYYTNYYLANGVCYVINDELDPKTVKKLVPLVNKSKQSLLSPRIYYYAFGQAGTSAIFSEDGKYLFLGAPGFYDWTGTVLTYSNPVDNRNYDNPSIPNPTADLSSDSYIGYSVTSGKFFTNAEMYVAVGAPRDKNSYGQVYIVKAVTSQDKFLVHMKKEGSQFGEYYGASVLGVDMNNDNFTDLLVGAPFYSLDSGGDEGKVYVYMSNGVGLQEYAEIYGENMPNARFGTCISSIGDINQDGWNDVAVGAPYENGKGAVYIYHGTASGMNPQYVQRIQASALSPSLLGFGISISRGLDIDGNYYPDIVIGAYDSSQAVLLRTQPVIKLTGKLDFSPQQINTNITTCNFEGKSVPCFNVTTCLFYTGKHSQLNLDFETQLYIDYSRQSRARSFLILETNPTRVIKRNVSVSIGIQQCFTDLAVVRNGTKDVITPVDFLFVYQLTNNRNKEFCKSCPVVDQMLYSNNITKAISFQTGCVTDNLCLSDLKVNATIIGYPKNTSLILGRNTNLTINIDVINEGEPAYIAELLIYLPPETPNVNQHFCTLLSDKQKQETNASLSCDLGNPLPKNKIVNIQIKIDVSKIPSNTETLSIFLKAKTGSKEIKPSDNDLELVIPFKMLADIVITGAFERELIQYDVKQTQIYISHTYFVMNHGPSPIEIVDIELFVPTAFKSRDGKSLIEFVSFPNYLQADGGEKLTIPAICNDSSIELVPAELDGSKSRDEIFDEMDLVAQKNSNRTSRRVSEEKTTMSNTEITTQSTKPVKDHSDKKTTDRKQNEKINCETADCLIIQCTASPFIDSRKFAKLNVTVRLNMSALDDILDPWYRIEFYTTAKISIRNDRGDIQPQPNSPDETSVKTIIVHPRPIPSEEVAVWIIYLSIGIGIILLTIISIVLIQMGFFNRQQKEKLREMMTSAEHKEWEPYLINDELEVTEEDASQK